MAVSFQDAGGGTPKKKKVAYRSSARPEEKKDAPRKPGPVSPYGARPAPTSTILPDTYAKQQYAVTAASPNYSDVGAAWGGLAGGGYVWKPPSVIGSALANAAKLGALGANIPFAGKTTGRSGGGGGGTTYRPPRGGGGGGGGSYTPTPPRWMMDMVTWRI